MSVSFEYCEAVCAVRMHIYFCPGGVSQDLPADLPGRIRQWANDPSSYIRDMETMITANNRIFKQRTVDIAVVTPEQALDWAFTGPNLRASGFYVIYVNHSPMTCMRIWILISRSDRTVIGRIAILFVSRRCINHYGLFTQCLDRLEKVKAGENG